MTEYEPSRLQAVSPLDTDPSNLEVDAGVDQMDGRFVYMSRCSLCTWYSRKIYSENASEARETVLNLFRLHKCAGTPIRWRLDY